MSRLLRWATARGEDRAALMAFQCTDPPRRRKVPPYGYEHDREWELVVQRYIHDLRPPCAPPVKVWVGYDDDGLGAVAVAEEMHSPENVMLKLMAVATRHREQGGGYADEMIEFVLTELESVGVALGYSSVAISAHIHKANSASQHLARRWGFRHIDWFDADHQIWAANLGLPQGEGDFADSGAPYLGRTDPPL